MGIIAWGIGITRIELDAHRSLTFCLRCRCKEHLIGEEQRRRFNFINRTDIVKTLLTVA